MDSKLIPGCIQNDNKAARRKRRRHTAEYVEELTTKPTQFAFECDLEAASERFFGL